ncbi:tetratricopeptide repeat protein [Isoalcanivorax beigongshangi]|uniref:Tetratricopeptide repeat protein n=1 Tax=Isoalcanivorax beigongshangi TaxID=3238810 RepID=A0ABV4AMJ2_9GAMM
MAATTVRLMVVGLTLALGACAVTPPGGDTGAGPRTIPQLPPQQPATALPPVAIAASSPTYSLLSAAQGARRQQDLGKAGRYLERALNVAGPGEATVLYRELAELRIQEGQPRAAEGLLMRALREAPAHDEWRAELWERIAAVRAQQGNSAGAKDARQRADTLRAGKPRSA